MRRLLFALSLGILLAACGGGSPNGSCTYTSTAGGTTAMACSEIDGDGITPDAVRTQCGAMMASGYTYSAGGCSHANVTGRCVTTNTVGSSTITQVIYFYAPVPAAGVRDSCARQNGTFFEN